MRKNEEFISLISLGIKTVRELIQQSRYLLYRDRYEKMITNLEDLKDATLNGTLASDFVYLGISKMLDHNDPDQLENIILKINKFYCDEYQKLK